MPDTDIESYRKCVEQLDGAMECIKKSAFTQMGEPQGSVLPPQGGEQGGMPPAQAPQADPAAMQQGAPAPAQPVDPGMQPAPGQVPPAQAPAAPAQAPAASQEVDKAIGDLANNQQQTASTIEEQQAGLDQIAKRQIAMEQELNDLRNAVKEPSPYEEPTQAPQAPQAAQLA